MDAMIDSPLDHILKLYIVCKQTHCLLTMEENNFIWLLLYSNTVVVIISFGRLSFQFSAAVDWNELQKSLKLESYISLTNFKHQLSE